MQSIYPVLKYSDAPAAIDFLERAFGFQRHAVHEGDAGAIVHGELRFGDQVVMVSSAGAGNPVYDQGLGRTTVYVAVDEVDTAARHAPRRPAPRSCWPPPTRTTARATSPARDPEGNIWSFGTYRPELG